MAKVIVRDGEPIESALRRFKDAVDKDGIMQELKRREFYRKPSEIRNEKKREKKRKIAKFKEKTEEIDQKFDKIFDTSY